MVASRVCKQRTEDDRPCGSPPLREGDYCLWHDPDHQDEVAESRRLGGQRRRRERILSGAYDFDGLDSISKIRRLVEVAVMDTLGLENSIARARTLAYLAQSAARLLEEGEMEERLAAVESVVQRRTGSEEGKRR